jgi:valyl-tRNA synthetase
MQDRYDHNEVEGRLRKFWELEGTYKFEPGSGKKVFAIDTPPPTVSGFIHVGHVFSYSQADFVARFKRMRGYMVFYPFGFDNNGIPTELLVEKNYNTTAEKVGREKFIDMVNQETNKYEQMYKEIWSDVGISVDWSLLYTTISKDVRRISQLSFLELNRAGRAYRKETPTIWCPKEATALSQMELKDKVLKSRFVTIRFSDDVVIATTRPELLPGCVAIFVNPDDATNRKLIGKRVKVPIFGQDVTVLADSRVDPSKGTGVVMCCTFGDLTDIEWYKAYNLDLRIVISENGRMLPEYFNGMKIREARDKIIADLKERGYVLAEKDIEHTVNVHERCGTEIEFLVKKQWYIRYLDLKQKFIELGNQIEWRPEYMHVRYDNWVNGLQWDWSISRQRYYGIPFPVWYCRKCGEAVFADEHDLPVNPFEDMPKHNCKCGSNEFTPEEDIFDTWQTSSLTPLINSGWKGGSNYSKEVFPMSLRPQAHDIISFWLFTTLVKSYLHTGKLPWKTALISGHALDSKGNPMHKSLGNTIDPKPVLERHGADAIRYWASLSRLGDDASFQEKDIITGARLANKLWNAAKLIDKISERGAVQNITNVIDKWVLSRAMLIVSEATELFEEYNYAGARRVVEEFFWFFSDNYLEFVKYRFYNNDKSASYSLRKAFLVIIKMLAPFIPYITEEIYQNIYKGAEESPHSIHLSGWPAYEEGLYDEEAMKEGDSAQKIVAVIRSWKHDNGLALNAELSELIVEGGDLKATERDIKGAMNIKKITYGKGEIEIPGTEFRVSLKK